MNSVCIYGQTQSIHINKSNETIILDGLLNEAIWKSAEKAEAFQMSYPHDTLKAVSQTEVMLCYNDNFLYIAAICHANTDGDYIAQSLKRDFSFPVNDAFAVFIDAFQDKATGFSFAVSPYGVQRDGIVSRGGEHGVTTSWDGVWFAEVNQEENLWTLEMAIPFNTLRFKSDESTWRINFARNDLKRNEISTWAPVPRNFNVATLAFTGELLWDQPPKSKGGTVNLNPYAAMAVSKDLASTDTKTKGKPNGGIDAKWAITSALNLDITINPDFSQVEVDQQVINLDRFEISFPERRFFFLENSDLFSGLGNSRVRPFFSRRIGVSGGESTRILGGLKLSGKINKDWRIGLLDVQTAKVKDIALSENYLVATIERRVLQGSTFDAFVTNRQAFPTKDSLGQKNYNTTAGAEFNFRSKNSNIVSKAFLHYATNNEKLNDGFAFGAKTRYKTRKINVFLGVDAVGENYITDMGYVPRLYYTNDLGESVRKDYVQYRTNGSYRFYFKKSKIIDFMGPFYGFNLYTHKNFNYQEHDLEVGWNIKFMNSSSLEFSYEESNPILFYNFSLSGLNAAFAPGNYHQNFLNAAFNTGKRQKLNGSGTIGYGQKYLGKQLSIKGEMNYRPKPWGAFSVNLSYQDLFDFPEIYGEASLLLIGTKTEISFTRDLFWTTFLQYNTQQNNFNINTRFQWRFRPMSDLYFVITNNYFLDPFATKDWMFVLKANYSFNL